MKKMERSKRSLTVRMKHEGDYGMKGSSIHDDSCIGINYAHMFSKVFPVTSHIVGFRSVLFVVNSIVVAVTIYSIFDLYANSL